MTKASRSRQDRKIKLRPLSWDEVKDLLEVQKYFQVPLGKQSAGETLILTLRLVAEQARQAAAKNKEQTVEATDDGEESSDSAVAEEPATEPSAEGASDTDSGDR